MASTGGWERLCLLLQDECLAYEHLLELLREEWSVLRKLEYLELLDVSRRKEVVLNGIRSVEAERSECVRILQQSMSHEEPLSWVEQCPVSEAAPAKQVLSQLVALGQQVKALSAQNSGLISRGMHVVQEALQVVHDGLGVKPLYGESGCLTFSSGVTSLNVKG